jgi:dihydroorotase
MKRTLIQGGRVIDPVTKLDGLFDICIEDGIITHILPQEKAPEKPNNNAKIPPTSSVQIIDASGMLVTPGLIDMHTHLREPGEEYKETIETGCLAAAHGGFTAVCCMPNTNPVNDNQSVTDLILKKANAAVGVRVYPVGAISRGLLGQALAEYGELKSAGVVALSDDGNPVMNAQMMRRALEYAKGFGLLVISHCEDLHLAAQGAMNEGALATRLGLPGIPNASESVMVARDIALSDLTETPVHIAHVSTRESVHLIRDAKNRGIPVTAETTPHYFTLTEESVLGYDTHAKVNPPLRSLRDREAICEGLADGTIDAIASDHAPHSSVEKDVEFEHAANGLIGLETSLSLSLQLIDKGYLDLQGIVEKMAINPAKILQRTHMGIQLENPADMTITDLSKEYTVKADDFQSKSKNTPFDGWTLKGKAVMTMVNGRILYNDCLTVTEKS